MGEPPTVYLQACPAGWQRVSMAQLSALRVLKVDIQILTVLFVEHVAGRFQPQNLIGSTKCLDCPADIIK